MNTYEKAIEKWGAEKQIIVAIEELSELQKALCKHLRGEDWTENIIEECADVLIMLEQIQLIFDIYPPVAMAKISKTNRLEKTLAGGKQQ
jgi:hypothetical protein